MVSRFKASVHQYFGKETLKPETLNHNPDPKGPCTPKSIYLGLQVVPI